KENKKKVFITSQDDNSLSFIKKKFYATNNAVFSIKLAKKFYESKKYKQALKWSLITNEIDSKNEQSWLMFAKIKDKMGKKQDAINALNEYLKRENSSKAISLLKEIKKSV
ncbi:MAG TPA: anaphase-promoting protein, partial [Campylobacterales bacterium]|nr:anaphase-promoting protein [Campylobacterales bacterium]